MSEVYRIPISSTIATKNDVIRADGDIEKARVFRLIDDLGLRLTGLRMILRLKDIAGVDFPHRDYLERYARELAETGQSDKRIRYMLGDISTSFHSRAFEELKKAEEAAKGGQR